MSNFPLDPAFARLKQLVDAILNEHGSADDWRELEKLIEANADCRRYFFDVLAMHADLFEILASDQDELEMPARCRIDRLLGSWKWPA